MQGLSGDWVNTNRDETELSYNCGYCGILAGPSKFYYMKGGEGAFIYICPNCKRPTYINKLRREQTPGPLLGKDVEHLPDEVKKLYNEAKSCLAVNASTATVLCCRKLLMNIAVNKGADEGKSFASYVNYLSDNHFISPGSEVWVDHIRKKGNEANHELPDINQDDAKELFEFTEMLLRFVFEMPGHMEKYLQQEST